MKIYCYLCRKEQIAMKYVSSKEFRAQLSQYCLEAEKEDIIIDRPGGRLLRLQAINQVDAKLLISLLGKPKGFEEKPRKKRGEGSDA